jgi:hypothetical protein
LESLELEFFFVLFLFPLINPGLIIGSNIFIKIVSFFNFFPQVLKQHVSFLLQQKGTKRCLNETIPLQKDLSPNDVEAYVYCKHIHHTASASPVREEN